MKHPRRSHLTENGENGANSDGVLSTTGDNERGPVPRKGYRRFTGKRRLELLYVVIVRGNVVPPYKRRE